MQFAVALLGAGLALGACDGSRTEAATPTSSMPVEAPPPTNSTGGPGTAIAPEPAPRPSSTVPGVPTSPTVTSVASAPPPPDDPELQKQIDATLASIAAKRGLPFLRPVPGKRLTRDEVIARITAKVERDTPAASLQAQGELLSALELTPAAYDFVAGVYALLKSQLAGFYDPDGDGAMFVLNDLDAAATKETLVHELVHALQDHNYDLEPRLKHRSGESDSIGAVHALAEGEAMSATFDVTIHDAFTVSEESLRNIMSSSVDTSAELRSTPRVLRQSLIAPYVDGYAFIQALRRRGGWRAVDGAWRRPPRSTEQLLHLDKYDSDEKPLAVDPVPFDTLGDGFSVLDEDVLGEQGLRLTFEQWTTPGAAAKASAGWGGDHYAVFVRGGAAPTYRAPSGELAVAVDIHFDTPADAAEAAAVLSTKFPRGCTTRRELGPLSWLRRSARVVILVGPYVRGPDGARQPSAANCELHDAWMKRIFGVV